MDPPGMMNDGSYSLDEICWQFPINGGGGGGGGGGRGQFGQSLGHFGGDSTRDVSGNDHVGLDQRGIVGLGVGVVGGTTRKRREMEEDLSKTGGGVSTSNANGNGNGNGVDAGCDGKRLKSRDGNHDPKAAGAEAEPGSEKPLEQNASKPPPDPPKQDYIHVRARRGQATDSHSLAERARREKISERMKILQDLVPGCNKVIGKALVLDEIINYIQSLQRQVEFLSMKLEAVNTRMTPGIEVFPPKDFGQQTFDTAGMAFGSQATREYSRGTSPEWLHMQIGGGFERTS
ncbi:hypothetical protein Tsubulata_032761 [Turnera subulata]|uniref:BHLH domain-containing protein n=1 Tax=Turnera subulata TaxID=218843 RepID=A0A9Q0GLT4_9ROSI|nr:hypothetical protein Tsubulata_032761 [Turnera subulata]